MNLPNFWDPNSCWSVPWVRQAAIYQPPPPQPHYAKGDYNHAYYAYEQPYPQPVSYAYEQPISSCVPPPTASEFFSTLSTMEARLDRMSSNLDSLTSLVMKLQERSLAPSEPAVIPAAEFSQPLEEDDNAPYDEVSAMDVIHSQKYMAFSDASSNSKLP